jgi:hypothetical protein
MGLGIFLLTLILVTLVVLVRRANQQEDEWIEDAFEDDEEYEDEFEDEEDVITEELQEDSSVADDKSGITLTDELRASLAQQAADVGVMQAAPGTEQGLSGWYVDVSSEMQYWNVGADGSWTRGE